MSRECRHTDSPGNSGERPSGGRWHIWIYFALYLIALFAILGPRLRLPDWRVTVENNTALAEAVRWRAGHLDLGRDYYEDARVGDRTYNVVGLAFTLLAIPVGASHEASGGEPDALTGLWYAAWMALAPTAMAFWAFRQVVRDALWAAVLAIYLLVGTSLAPVLERCGGGSIYYINHVLAVTGILLLCGDLLAKRRIWPAAIGLALAAWSRQMTIFYAIPLLALAWRSDGAAGPCADASPADEPPSQSHETAAADGSTSAVTCVGSLKQTRARLAVAIASVLLIGAVPAALNWLKFGNPLDTGYGRMFEGRTDRIGTRAQEALFSPRYVPMHLRAALLDAPWPDIRQGRLYLDRSELAGGSIFLTSPLLIAVLVTLPKWWHGRGAGPRRWLAVFTLPVIAGLMCYVTTGSEGSGYYRYALDFMPVWLMVAAPQLVAPKLRSWTLIALAWSGLYFALVR